MYMYMYSMFEFAVCRDVMYMYMYVLLPFSVLLFYSHSLPSALDCLKRVEV